MKRYISSNSNPAQFYTLAYADLSDVKSDMSEDVNTVENFAFVLDARTKDDAAAQLGTSIKKVRFFNVCSISPQGVIITKGCDYYVPVVVLQQLEVILNIQPIVYDAATVGYQLFNLLCERGNTSLPVYTIGHKNGYMIGRYYYPSRTRTMSYNVNRALQATPLAESLLDRNNYELVFTDNSNILYIRPL